MLMFSWRTVALVTVITSQVSQCAHLRGCPTRAHSTLKTRARTNRERSGTKCTTACDVHQAAMYLLQAGRAWAQAHPERITAVFLASARNEDHYLLGQRVHLSFFAPYTRPSRTAVVTRASHEQLFSTRAESAGGACPGEVLSREQWIGRPLRQAVLKSTCPNDRKARVHFGSDWRGCCFWLGPKHNNIVRLR